MVRILICNGRESSKYVSGHIRRDYAMAFLLELDTRVSLFFPSSPHFQRDANELSVISWNWTLSKKFHHMDLNYLGVFIRSEHEPLFTLNVFASPVHLNLNCSWNFLKSFLSLPRLMDDHIIYWRKGCVWGLNALVLMWIVDASSLQQYTN
jgi:hypothetical protein